MLFYDVRISSPPSPSPPPDLLKAEESSLPVNPVKAEDSSLPVNLVKAEELVDLVVTWAGPFTPERKHDCIKFGVSTKRYEDNDELKILINSIDKYALQLVKRIFVVVSGTVSVPKDIPKWLTNHPLVEIVTHSQILPPTSLPCFSCRPIETQLYKIPTLTENFLYANDDCFFTRTTTRADWFNDQGQYYMDVDTGMHKRSNGNNSHATSIRNSKKLLAAPCFDIISHTICMLSKTGYLRLLQKHPEILERNLASQLRSPRDVNTVMMVSNLDKLEKRNQPRPNTGCYLFTVTPNLYFNRLKRNWLVLFNGDWKNPRLGCINDERKYKNQHQDWVNRCFYRNWGIDINPLAHVIKEL
jgi:hypothetical protein